MFRCLTVTRLYVCVFQEDDARRNSDASGNFKDFNKSSLGMF